METGKGGNRLGNIKAEQTVFFLCDMQEKFKPVIAYFKEILVVAKKLVRFLGIVVFIISTLCSTPCAFD